MKMPSVQAPMTPKEARSRVDLLSEQAAALQERQREFEQKCARKVTRHGVGADVYTVESRDADIAARADIAADVAQVQGELHAARQVIRDSDIADAQGQYQSALADAVAGRRALLPLAREAAAAAVYFSSTLDRMFDLFATQDVAARNAERARRSLLALGQPVPVSLPPESAAPLAPVELRRFVWTELKAGHALTCAEVLAKFPHLADVAGDLADDDEPLTEPVE